MDKFSTAHLINLEKVPPPANPFSSIDEYEGKLAAFLSWLADNHDSLKTAPTIVLIVDARGEMMRQLPKAVIVITGERDAFKAVPTTFFAGIFGRWSFTEEWIRDQSVLNAVALRTAALNKNATRAALIIHGDDDILRVGDTAMRAFNKSSLRWAAFFLPGERGSMTAHSLKFPALPIDVSSKLALEHRLSKLFQSTEP